MLLAQVFPLSERSAMNVLGGFNVGNVLRVEGLDEFQQRSAAAAGGGGGVGYEFYAKFWGVQQVFTDPAGTILTTTSLASSSSARGGSSTAAAASVTNRVQAYESFVKDVTDILEALESTPIVPSDKKKNDVNNDKNQQQQEQQVRHHKYLTSSQLLHLQLKDPTLRIHFLTQLLIILSYLASLPPSQLPTGVQSTAGADTSKLMGQIRQTQMKQLGLIEKRVQKLLLRASCGGSGGDDDDDDANSSNNGMWKALQWILRDRESMWKNWKKAKCLPAMDRVATTTATVGGGGCGTNYTASGSDVQKLLSLAGKKRKLGHTSSSTNTNPRSSASDTLTIETLVQVTSEIKTSSQPTLTAFLDPYVEALDPENGIEGEYHPRNDKVYTWRGLRLMARDQDDDEGHLKRFGKLRRKDGDFEGIVRDIWKERGEEIPGKMSEDYYQEDIEEEEEVTGAATATGGKTDAEMDDVSVGSTQEAANAKKEEEEAKKKRMAEFEKAAMEVEEDILDETTDKTAVGNGDTEKAAAVDEGTKSNRSSYASLADAVAPNTKAVEPKEEKKKDEKPAEVKKEEKAESKEEEKTTESKKENGNNMKKEENSSKKGSPNSKSTSAKKRDDGKNGGGKGKKEGDNEKKDESKGSTKSNSSNSNKGSDNSNNNDSKQQSRSRAKFTPPQKVQQQHQNKSEPQRDNSNPRGGGGGGGGGGGRRGGNDRRGNNMPPPQQQPPQSRGGNRDGHGRTHTPPNPGGHSPRGGDQRGNNGPPRGGGGGPGRGWEPPPGKGFHPGQGGGGGRGGGGGGGGGRGGSDRRRHGRR